MMKNLSEQLLKTVQKLVKLGLNKGTAGNCSVRFEGGFLVTPSGMAVEDMTPQSMVQMAFDGSFEQNKTQPNIKPTSEWRFHRDILANRPEINAVIHTHSQFATTLACLHKSILPFHYMIAVTGADTIRCAPYALFGTQVLSDHALAALCEQYWRILQINPNPPLLTEQEMRDVFQQFRGYGKWAS